MAGIHNLTFVGSFGRSTPVGPVGFVFNPVISINTTNYNLRNAAIAAGWNAVEPLVSTVTVNSGIYVSANTVSGYAFDTGALTAGSVVSLVNNGFIIGMGGAGGRASWMSGLSPVAGTIGANAGPGLIARAPISITNNGTIGGGGGGGGGARTRYYAYVDKISYYYVTRGGGGGGGRTGLTNTAGGLAGQQGSYAPQFSGGFFAVNGGTGTLSAAGAGGRGDGINGSNDGGVGGGGGGWGASGASGSNGVGYVGYVSAGGAYIGGTGGSSIAGNSNITWINTGTRLGAISA